MHAHNARTQYTHTRAYTYTLYASAIGTHTGMLTDSIRHFTNSMNYLHLKCHLLNKSCKFPQLYEAFKRHELNESSTYHEFNETSKIQWGTCM